MEREMCSISVLTPPPLPTHKVTICSSAVLSFHYSTSWWYKHISSITNLLNTIYNRKSSGFKNVCSIFTSAPNLFKTPYIRYQLLRILINKNPRIILQILQWSGSWRPSFKSLKTFETYLQCSM